MKFKTMTATAVSIYVAYGSDEFTHNYVNEDEVIDVDFEFYVESFFLQDCINGLFAPMDDEAEQWLSVEKAYLC